MRWPIVEGELSTGVPFLRFGTGPPLVMAAGVTVEHANPTGVERRMALSITAPYADHFTVYLVSRRRGLTAGATMSDIAGHIADGVAADIGGPVHLHGVSTGGTVALQLAIDHPESVQRLVLMSSACRLAERGRALQATLAAKARAGDPRGAMADMAGQLSLPGTRTVVARLLAISERRAPDVDPADMLVVIEAEDRFDAESDLAKVAAPTLVIGGARDVFYSRELFELTAAGVQDGRAVVHPRWGHVRAQAAASANHLALGFLLASVRSESERQR